MFLWTGSTLKELTQSRAWCTVHSWDTAQSLVHSRVLGMWGVNAAASYLAVCNIRIGIIWPTHVHIWQAFYSKQATKKERKTERERARVKERGQSNSPDIGKEVYSSASLALLIKGIPLSTPRLPLSHPSIPLLIFSQAGWLGCDLLRRRFHESDHPTTHRGSDLSHVIRVINRPPSSTHSLPFSFSLSLSLAYFSFQCWDRSWKKGKRN